MFHSGKINVKFIHLLIIRLITFVVVFDIHTYILISWTLASSLVLFPVY